MFYLQLKVPGGFTHDRSLVRPGSRPCLYELTFTGLSLPGEPVFSNQEIYAAIALKTGERCGSRLLLACPLIIASSFLAVTRNGQPERPSNAGDSVSKPKVFSFLL